MLQEELGRAEQGEFRCLLILGEPGVGKTRLAGELLARHRRRAIGLSARAYPFGGTTAYGLWADALEPHLRGLAPHRVSALCAGFLDDLAGLLHSVAALRGGGGERQPPRARLLQGLSTLIGNLAADSTVVVLLDDVHLADASSWEALHHVAHTLSSSRLLMLATARPAELDDQPVASDVVLGLEQEGLLRRVTVEPLDAQAVAALAGAVIDGAPPPALVDWLAERSRGNPLFTLGLLLALLEEGADLSAPRLRHLPEAMADRVRSRLRLLEEPARAILELLAVLGRRVALGVLVDLSDRSADEVGGLLEKVCRSRLAAEVELGTELSYEISHPVIQEAIYQGIGGARRRLLHRRAARVLLAAGRLGEAAPHFSRSAEAGDAQTLEVLARALREAEEREAHREALTILGSLVELLPPGDARWGEIVDALSWRAEWVVDHRGDTHAAMGIPAMRRIDAALEGLPDPARRAVVRFRLSSFLAWGAGELEEAERVCVESVALFEDAGDRPGTLLASHELAWIRMLAGGDMQTLQTAAARIAEVAEGAGERSVQERALRTVLMALMVRGRLDEAEEHAMRAGRMAQEGGNLYALIIIHTCRAMIAALRGDAVEATRRLEEAGSVNPSWRESYPLLEQAAGVHWVMGDLRGAVGYGQQALRLGPAAVSRRGAHGLMAAALASAEMGQLGEARRLATAATAVYRGRDWGYDSRGADWAAALVAWREGGDRRDALARLRGAAEGLCAMGAWMMTSLLLLDTAEMAAASGDARFVQAAATRLEAIGEETGRDLDRGLARIAAAWAELVAQQPAVAASSARQAAELLAAPGHRPYRGRALDVLGRALSGSDRRAAAEAFRAAVADFDACGAAWRCDRTLEALRALGRSARRAVAAALGPASLTGREREVAALAVQGHTAREIGERLFIGERTVEDHLASVYAKLGVASKRELARRATELEL